MGTAQPWLTGRLTLMSDEAAACKPPNRTERTMKRSAPWNGTSRTERTKEQNGFMGDFRGNLIKYNLVFFCVAVASERELKAQLRAAATFICRIWEST